MSTLTYLRSFRVSGYAIFDFAASLIGVFLLSPLLSRGCAKLGLEVPRRNWVYLTLPLGVASHLAAGKSTPLTSAVMDLHGHYLLKAVMLALCILGVRQVRRTKKGPPPAS